MRSDDFSEFGELIKNLLANVNARGRRDLSRKIARELRRSQQQRIKAQKNPDGSAFAPRKQAQKERPAKPIRFLYKKPGGKVRVAEMTSWARQGRMLVGFDREAGGIRSFRQDRVERWLKARASGGKRLRSKAGHIKRKAMFRKMGSHLRMRSDADAAQVGFHGRVSRIARVHQYGLRDRVSESGGEAQYAQRELLGLTEADMRMIEDMILEHLAGW